MTVTAELGGGHGHAASEIEHHKTVHQRTRLKDDLPHIVFSQVARFHCACDYIRRHVRCGGAPGYEVVRILAGALAFAKKHQLEEARVIEGVIEEDIEDLEELVIDVARQLQLRKLRRQLHESFIGDLIQQTVAVGIVTVEGHGCNADSRCYPAHGDAICSLFIKEAPGGAGYPLCCRCRHVYSVYQNEYTPYTFGLVSLQRKAVVGFPLDFLWKPVATGG